MSIYQGNPVKKKVMKDFNRILFFLFFFDLDDNNHNDHYPLSFSHDNRMLVYIISYQDSDKFLLLL